MGDGGSWPGGVFRVETAAPVLKATATPYGIKIRPFHKVDPSALGPYGIRARSGVPREHRKFFNALNTTGVEGVERFSVRPPHRSYGIKQPIQL